MPNKRADPIGDVAAQIVADDPRIRERMTKIVDALLDDAETTIKLGSPTERAALMKQVIPALLRSMQGADANASEAAEAQAYERMMQTLRGETPVPADG